MFQWKRVLYSYGETVEQAKSSNNPLLYLSYLCRCSFMWWVLVGSVLGLVASSLMIVYWFSRLRLALAEKGWKYTSTLGALPWIIGLFNSVYVLLRELTVIQKGGTVDSTLLYTLAILDWIVLATMGTGIILDAVIRRANLQHNRL